MYKGLLFTIGFCFLLLIVVIAFEFEIIRQNDVIMNKCSGITYVYETHLSDHEQSDIDDIKDTIKEQ